MFVENSVLASELPVFGSGSMWVRASGTAYEGKVYKLAKSSDQKCAIPDGANYVHVDLAVTDTSDLVDLPKSVIWLAVDGTGKQLARAFELLKHRNLQHLHIVSDEALSDAVFGAIQFTELWHLEVVAPTITIGAQTDLSGLKGVRTLVLNGEDFEYSHLRRLCSVAPLQYVRICCSVPKVPMRLDFLPVGAIIRALDVTGALLSTESLDYISEQCKSLEYLGLPSITGVNRWIRGNADKFKRLAALEVRECDLDLVTVEQLPVLKELGMDGGELGAGHAGAGRLKLERCHLGRTSIGLSTIELLGSAKSMVYFSIAYPILGAKQSCDLSPLDTVKTLVLRLDEKHLCDALRSVSQSKSIRELHVLGTDNITSEIVDVVASMTCLTVLNLHAWGRGLHESMLGLTKLTKLKVLVVNCGLDVDDRVLTSWASGFPELEVVILRSCNVASYRGLVAFMHHASLKYLGVSCGSNVDRSRVEKDASGHKVTVVWDP